MSRELLKRALLVYTGLAGGATVLPVAYLYGNVIVLLLIVSLFLFSVMHARTGSSPTMSMDGGGEGDFTEVDAQTNVETSYGLPGDGQTALTFYLVGVAFWSFAGLFFV